MRKYPSFTQTIICLLTLTSQVLSSQNTGSIKVKLTEAEYSETIPFANTYLLKVSKDTVIQVGVSTTNDEGLSLFSGVELGLYMVKAVYVGYNSLITKNILVKRDSLSYVQMTLNKPKDKYQTDTIIYLPYYLTLPEKGATITREEYEYQMRSK